MNWQSAINNPPPDTDFYNILYAQWNGTGYSFAAVMRHEGDWFKRSRHGPESFWPTDRDKWTAIEYPRD